MGVTVQDLMSLSQASVDAIEARLIQLIQELNPGVNLKVGVVRMLVLHLKSVLDAASEKNTSLIEQSGSLNAILANPDLQDQTLVDRVLGNYRVVRNPGAKAGGELTIVLSSLTPVIIVKGAVFTIDGLTFTSNESYAARTSSAMVTGPNDRLLTLTQTDKYSFPINVTASAIGVAGNIAAGTTATPASSIPAFVQAYTLTDFTGGADPDTNAAMVDRLKLGLAVKALSNRTTTEALIRDQAAFKGIGPMSIVGFGDAEMIRDQHSIWPGSLGGRNDIYTRTSPLYQTVTLTLTASLISKTAFLGTWQFGIGRDDAPGFYEVVKVLLPEMAFDADGFVPTSDVRSIDLTGLDFQADIVAVKEGVYSRYQAAVLQFDDTTTDATSLPLGSTQDYQVVIRVMPLLADIQDFLMNREVRPTMSDVLVKAPLPVFTTASFTMNMLAGAPTVDTALVATTVANAINALGFTGELAGSLIGQVLHQTFPGLLSVTSMVLTGRLRQPDGTETVLGPSTGLTIASDPANMIGEKTTVFFLAPSDITVTVVAP